MFITFVKECINWLYVKHAHNIRLWVLGSSTISFWCPNIYQRSSAGELTSSQDLRAHMFQVPTHGYQMCRWDTTLDTISFPTIWVRTNILAIWQDEDKEWLEHLGLKVIKINDSYIIPSQWSPTIQCKWTNLNQLTVVGGNLKSLLHWSLLVDQIKEETSRETKF